MDSKKILKIAKEEVERLKELMSVDSEVKCDIEDGREETKVVKVVFEGDDLGYMIGNRGKHLLALQYILSNIIRGKVRQEDEDAKVAIMVDVGGYRQQQMDRIEQLALQKADDARILGDSVDLPPMSPAERRVVHTALGRFDDIKTESQGEDRERFVRIIPLSAKAE